MAQFRFPKGWIFILMAIFCSSASYSADLENSRIPDSLRLRRDDANNKLKDARSSAKQCVLPPATPDNTYIATCPKKENCQTKPGEQAMEFTVLTSKCNPGYAQFQEGGVSSNHNIINVCFNGTWAPSIPKCKRICNKISSDELDFTCSLYLGGPIVPCNSTLLEGAVVVPRCKPQYHTIDRVNYRHVTCKADGNWDRPFFKCTSDCGKTRASVVNLIANGRKEKRGQSPWFVAVYTTQNSNKTDFICGGTLISPQFVVSMARCFYDTVYRMKLDPQLFFVMVAKETRDYKRMDYSTTKKYSIKSINFPNKAGHSSYNFGPDLAVLQLSEPIVISEDVLPACIYWDDYTEFSPPENTLGKVSGFGLTETEELASELQTTEIPFINHTECIKQVSEDFADEITLGTFCAGSKQGPGPRAGDSGGGLLFKDGKDGRFYLRGVVSAREIGNSSITVFTDISIHMPWIKKVILAAQ